VGFGTIVGKNSLMKEEGKWRGLLEKKPNAFDDSCRKREN